MGGVKVTELMKVTPYHVDVTTCLEESKFHPDGVSQSRKNPLPEKHLLIAFSELLELGVS